jgi:thioesterase domain-containing protein
MNLYGDGFMIEEKYKEAATFLEQAVNIIRLTGVKVVSLRDRYAKIMLPFEPNINHIGTIYAGSLFIVAEFSGGVIYYASFDHTKFYPIVKEVSIRYRRPALTDVTLEVQLTEEQVQAIEQAAEEKGKQDWTMDLELKDAHGQICCLVHGTWQIRKFE